MDWLELKDRLGSDRLPEDADLNCSVNSFGRHWRGLPAAVAGVDHPRFGQRCPAWLSRSQQRRSGCSVTHDNPTATGPGTAAAR